MFLNALASALTPHVRGSLFGLCRMCYIALALVHSAHAKSDFALEFKSTCRAALGFLEGRIEAGMPELNALGNEAFLKRIAPLLKPVLLETYVVEGFDSVEVFPILPRGVVAGLRPLRYRSFRTASTIEAQRHLARRRPVGPTFFIFRRYLAAPIGIVEFATSSRNQAFVWHRKLFDITTKRPRLVEHYAEPFAEEDESIRIRD